MLGDSLHQSALAAASPFGGNAISLLEEIKVKQIVNLYRTSLGVDVASHFAGIDRIGFYRCENSGLRFFYPRVTGSEQFYESLQTFPWYYLQTKSEFECAKRLIASQDSVLEVGCGFGHFAETIGSGRYVGLEFSRRARDVAHAHGISVFNASVEEFSRQHVAEFNVVCSFQVLEHVRDVVSFIEGCLLCLRSQGRLIFSVPNGDSYLGFAVNSPLNMPPHHVTWWSKDVFKYVAKRYGLRLEALHTERVMNEHLAAYATTVIGEAFSNALGLPRARSLLRSSLSYRMMNRVASVLAKFIVQGLQDYRLRPVGHTLTVVFQKQ